LDDQAWTNDWMSCTASINSAGYTAALTIPILFFQGASQLSLAWLARTEFLTLTIRASPGGKRKPIYETKWRSSLSACGRVLKSCLTPPTLLERFYDSYPVGQFSQQKREGTGTNLRIADYRTLKSEPLIAPANIRDPEFLKICNSGSTLKSPLCHFNKNQVPRWSLAHST
jgi:hypothetical protein